ncbi:MAG: hypothetical protein ACTMIR_04910 [Cellulomonadaceae bacterium]
MAAAVLVLVSVGAALVVTTYDARAARDIARTPIVAVSTEQSRAWWSDRVYFADGRYVSVVVMEPRIDDAPLPAGVDSWPEPGGLVVSPAVADDPAFSALLDSLGTRIEAQVEPDGLTDAAERLVYVRPRPDVEMLWDQGFEIVGYGQAHGRDFGTLGSSLNTAPLSVFLILYGAFALVPALVLVAVAARIGAEARDYRLALLAVLGARWRDRVVLLLGDLLGPWAFGSVAGGFGVAALLLGGDVTLPGVGYTLQARDARAVWPTFALAALCGAALSLVITVLLNRDRRTAGTTRPAAATRPAGMRHMVIVPVVVASGTMLVNLTRFENESVQALVYYCVIVALVFSLPGFVSAVTSLLARGALGIARRRGAPGVLAAARTSLSLPRSAARMTAALVVAILLTGQVQLWTSKLGSMTLGAIALDERVSGRVVAIEVPEGDVGVRVLDAVAEFAAPFLLRTDPGPDGRTSVTGECPAIESLGMSCTTREPQNIAALSPAVISYASLVGATALYADPVDSVNLVGVPDDGASSWSAVSTTGARIDVDSINYALAQIAAPAPRAEGLADSWIASGQDSRAKARWVGFFGSFAAFTLAMAVAGSFVTASAAISTQMGGWAALGARRRNYAAVAWWRTLLPVTTATVVATITSVIIASPFLTESMGGRLPAGTVLATLVTPLVVAAVAASAATWMLVRASERWRPGTT